MFTVSKNVAIIFDMRSLGINGLRSATKINEGRKIPMVAAKAPPGPPSCHPMKVADENTGPGVNCPTAIASINCCLVSKPVATNSASKNANNTYPLPYRIAPIFKKIRNSLIDDISKPALLI